VRPDRPRLLLGVLLLAAAMPVRFPVHTPVFTSVSVLDVVLLVVAVTLVLDLPFHRLDLGYRTIFVVLAVPAVAIVLSLAWSQDRAATLAVAGFTLESVVVYLFVTRELEGLSSERIVALLERFVVLLIVPAVLLLLHVPGFQPEQPGLSPSSGDYLGYYTRLSHPVLGRSNNLATVLVVFVPVLLWWGHTRRKRAAAFVGFLGLAAVIATQSRGVVLASVVALGIFALVRPPQRIRGRPFFGKVFGATVVLALAGVVFYELNPLTRELGASRFSLENVSLRIALYGEAFGRLGARPWTGFGPGVVPDGNTALTVGTQVLTAEQGDVHNTYVQQLLSFGVPVGVVVSVALLTLPVWFFVRARAVPAAGVVGLALTIELVSFAFESSFEGSVLRVIFYLSVGLLAGLVRRLEADGEANAVAPAAPGRQSTR
jgi:hypothetical protein